MKKCNRKIDSEETWVFCQDSKRKKIECPVCLVKTISERKRIRKVERRD